MDFTSTFLKLIDVDEVRVWRVSLRVRVLCALMAVLMLALTAFVAFGAADDVTSPAGVALAFLLICDVVLLRIVRYAFGSVTTASPEGLVIGTSSLRRSRRQLTVPWKVIDSCRPGDNGITIACNDGRRVLSAVPQRAHTSRGAHRKTEADYFALYVTERARLIRQISA